MRAKFRVSMAYTTPAVAKRLWLTRQNVLWAAAGGQLPLSVLRVAEYVARRLEAAVN